MPQRVPFLGQLLVSKKIITFLQMEEALREQEKTGETFGHVLVRLGFVSEEMISLPSLASQLGVGYVYLKEKTIPEGIIAKIPAQFASHYQAVPFSYENGMLKVAMANPMDIHALDELALITHDRVEAVLADEEDIAEAIKRYYGVGAETIEQMMGRVPKKERKGSPVADIDTVDSEASIGKFINQILLEAYKDRATDIHIEPFEDELKIRYRIDGVLYEAKVPQELKHFRDAINARIKILSNLDIAEKRLPQDGRFKVRVGDMDLDLRVSFLPTPEGESVVIRILSSNRLFNMEELGLSGEQLNILDHLIQKPHGIIFVTGPTGSGKTTTLYSCLSRIKDTSKKIITIEDPIEYQLNGITQVQINPAIGLTFAAGLRSMLRHDPDIMMVGEVRDRETADITIQVALTGHLVFSTLHTNDAASAVARLLDMGIEPYLVASSVQCFMAQRLVRVLCPSCKTPVALDKKIMTDFGLNDIPEDAVIYEAKGCESCRFTGYHGREGIYEFLVVNDIIRDLIISRATASEIKSAAVKNGMRTLRQDGWQKVLKGITTPSEVMRVTQEEGV